MTTNPDDDPWLGGGPRAPARTIPRPLVFVALGCGLLVLAALAALGVFLIRVGNGPAIEAVPGAKVDAKTVRYLKERGLLAEGETLLYFYSEGLFDAEDQAVFCTDQKLCEYDVEGGEAFSAASFPYEEIEALEFFPAEDDGPISLLEVRVREREPHTLHLPTDEGGDREFEAVAREHWERARR